MSAPQSATGPDSRDGRAKVVVMADRSPDADRIADALRSDGFSVITSDLVALPERVARLTPWAVVIDIEHAHADAVVPRLLTADEQTRPLIVALGARQRAAALGLSDGAWVKLLERPVAVAVLLAHLRAPPEDSISELPPAVRSSRSSIPMGPDSDVLADFPAIAGLPEVESMPPEVEGSPTTARTGQLSPEIEALLENAAQRVPSSEPAPMPYDPSIPVPSDLWGVIDDMLAPEEASPPTRGGMSLSGWLQHTAPTARATPRPFRAEPQPAEDEELRQRALEDDQPSSGGPGSTTTGLTGVGTHVGDEEDDEGLGGRLLETEPPARPALGIGQRGDATAAADDDEADDAGHPADRPTAPPQRVPARSDRSSSRAPARPADRPQSRASSMPPSQPMPTFSDVSLTAADAPSQRPTREGLAGLSADPRSSDLPSGSASSQSQPPSTAVETWLHSLPSSGSSPPPKTRLDDRFGPGTQQARTPYPPAPSAPPGRTRGEQRGLERGTPGERPGRRAGARRPSPAPPFEDSVGDPIDGVARAVRGRVSGGLVLTSQDGERIRRILLRDGDLVNAASDHPGDGLVFFLVERGDLRPEVADARAARLPQAGRHAAAALIANGYLGQDDLWPVLRAHAEWIIGRALSDDPSTISLEAQPPDRLRDEPNVFGGAAGVEVFIDSVRRVLHPEDALRRLGGRSSILSEGPAVALLAESALADREVDAIRHAPGMKVGEILATEEPELAAVLCALVALGILAAQPSSRRSEAVVDSGLDPLDADAVRAQVAARLALVREADYFSLLGLLPTATSYDIRRAYLDLRRRFEPQNLLTAATADLHDDLLLIVEVLDEAYDILRDPNRRSRYRRAIEATR